MRDESDENLRDPREYEVHVCSRCKSKLLEEWNAYCQ